MSVGWKIICKTSTTYFVFNTQIHWLLSFLIQLNLLLYCMKMRKCAKHFNRLPGDIVPNLIVNGQRMDVVMVAHNRCTFQIVNGQSIKYPYFQRQQYSLPKQPHSLWSLNPANHFPIPIVYQANKFKCSDVKWCMFTLNYVVYLV